MAPLSAIKGTDIIRRRRDDLIEVFIWKCRDTGQHVNLTNYGFITDNVKIYEGWNFNSGNYLFTADIK